MREVLISLGVMLVCCLFLVVAQVTGAKEAIATEIAKSPAPSQVAASQPVSEPDAQVLIAQAPSTEGAPTMITTDSGLKYVDLVEGTGAMPQAGQTVVVHYTGTLEDGTKFDSSRDRNQPFEFSLGYGEVIKGWDEALSTMQVGDRRQLIIPPALGYGSQSLPDIPPNSTLIFDVELLEINPPLDVFGDSFDTATSFTLGLGASQSEFVGNIDPNDYLRFTLPLAGQINLNLTELSANANLELYDSNRNLIKASANTGTTNETITQALASVGSTYYIRVVQAPNTDAGYKLSYTFTPS